MKYKAGISLKAVWNSPTLANTKQRRQLRMQLMKQQATYNKGKAQ